MKVWPLAVMLMLALSACSREEVLFRGDLAEVGSLIVTSRDNDAFNLSLYLEINPTGNSESSGFKKRWLAALKRGYSPSFSLQRIENVGVVLTEAGSPNDVLFFLDLRSSKFWMPTGGQLSDSETKAYLELSASKRDVLSIPSEDPYVVGQQSDSREREATKARRDGTAIE
jgi:hypothetical protein